MAAITFVVWPTKDPSEKADYGFKWKDELEGDRITASTWSITGAGLTISSSPAASFDDATTTVWLEGGTAGTDYIVVNQITTAGGRTLEASAKLPCRNSG